MNRIDPEQLHEKTPAWFKEWHDRAFWHFTYRVERKLGLHDKLLWIIIGIILSAAVASFFF